MLTAFCGIFIVNAMPTAEEIAAVEPLVQEVMKAETEALRRGKKTREQVGDAAVALAKEAQAPAEKYILLTGAFDYYMRGGSYDKAASALEAVRKAVPDWKGSDELALIEKAMRSVAFGKGGPVRERYDELKERQQYALRLKKALEQAKAKPGDKNLQLQVAAYYAALDRWPQALDAFIAGSSPACAAAAKLEKESAPPAKIADAWWSALDVKPDFLSSAIRAHAADLYTKALADPTFAGLPRVAAEKRLKEASAAEQETPRGTSAAESAKHTGVKLIGNTVKLNKGILSGFSDGSYAVIDAPFSPAGKPFEMVFEFTAPDNISGLYGLTGGIGDKNGFSPWFINKGVLSGYISAEGKAREIASALRLKKTKKKKKTYRLKCEWNGRSYVWSHFTDKWNILAKVDSPKDVFNGLRLCLGINRGKNCPLQGTVNLNVSYILIDGKLWWEGVKGAYKNAR